MHFARPEILTWLWLVPLVWGLLKWLSYRQEKVLRRFVSDPLVPVISLFDRRAAGFKRLFLVLALFFSLLALARPQWGYEIREIKRRGLDILIVLDASRSMLTEDVKPNRFERAKLAVKDLLRKLSGDRIGLIAFAGDAFLACPLTVDYAGYLLSLNDLDTTSVPRGGTNISRAIQEAIKEYDNTPSKFKTVIMITDGENLEDDPMPWVEKARQKGIKIYTVGIGTQGGELIRTQDNLGRDTFVKDEADNFVKSRLNEKLLQDIALKTGGAYVHAAGAVMGLDLIYDRDLSKLERRDIGVSKMSRDYFERFQIPLGIALVFLCLETFWSQRRRVEDEN